MGLVYHIFVPRICIDKLLADRHVHVRYHDSSETIYMRSVPSYSRYNFLTPQTSNAPPFSKSIRYPGKCTRDKWAGEKNW